VHDDAHGHVLIVDHDHALARSVDKSNGIITTIAGNGVAGFPLMGVRQLTPLCFCIFHNSVIRRGVSLFVEKLLTFYFQINTLFVDQNSLPVAGSRTLCFRINKDEVTSKAKTALQHAAFPTRDTSG
jgi:hypothetical protein